ncbi:MAG: hypothetical protein OXH57_08670 [Ekhidna sp.]|nr:hypothetical protein [Ekhidna sp.]
MNQVLFTPALVMQLFRIRRSTFFKAIKTLIEWNSLSDDIDKVYRQSKSKKEQSAYLGLLLF